MKTKILSTAMSLYYVTKNYPVPQKSHIVDCKNVFPDKTEKENARINLNRRYLRYLVK